MLLQHVDDVKFVLGKYLGETVGILDGLGHRRGFLGLGVTEGGAVENVCTHPQHLGGLPGDRQGVAGHHLDLHAHLGRGRDGGFGVFTRRIEQRQYAKKLPFPVAIRPRHTESTEAARGEVVDRLVDSGFHGCGVSRQFLNDLRRPLRHLECASVRGLDGGLGAFVDWVEGLEMCDLIGLQRLLVLQASQDREIDRVVVLRLRSQCAGEDDLVGCDLAQAEWIAKRQLVLGQRASLVGAQHVHPGQFLDGDQLAHDRLLLREQAGADRHRHRQNRWHRYGDRRHRQHERKLQHGKDRLAAIDTKSDDHRHHGQRQHDQVVADLQHGFLEMADGDRRLHQFRRLAEIGFAARRVDQSANLAAADD